MKDIFFFRNLQKQSNQVEDNGYWSVATKELSWPKKSQYTTIGFYQPPIEPLLNDIPISTHIHWTGAI